MEKITLSQFQIKKYLNIQFVFNIKILPHTCDKQINL